LASYYFRFHCFSFLRGFYLPVSESFESGAIRTPKDSQKSGAGNFALTIISRCIFQLGPRTLLSDAAVLRPNSSRKLTNLARARPPASSAELTSCGTMEQSPPSLKSACATDLPDSTDSPPKLVSAPSTSNHPPKDVPGDRYSSTREHR